MNTAQGNTGAPVFVPPTVSRLPRLVRPGLDLLIVGFNPSIPAWQAGHYYANPRNEFYRLLFRHGLTDRLLTPDEDVLLPGSYGIGITDLVPRPSAGIGTIPAVEFQMAGECRRKELIAAQPSVLCCNGYGVFRYLTGRVRGPIDEHLPASLCTIPVYAVPSSSGAACGLAHARGEAWRRVADAVAARRTPRAPCRYVGDTIEAADRRCGDAEFNALDVRGGPGTG